MASLIRFIILVTRQLFWTDSMIRWPCPVSALNPAEPGVRGLCSALLQGMQGWPLAPPSSIHVPPFQGFTGLLTPALGQFPTQNPPRDPSSLQAKWTKAKFLPEATSTRPSLNLVAVNCPDPPMHCPSFARHLDTSESVQPWLEELHAGNWLEKAQEEAVKSWD